MTGRVLDVVDLGRQPYRDVLELQRAMREERLSGTRSNDLLILVEHDPVYTMGRATQESSLPVNTELLQTTGADVVEIERGGDVTWHGPGQLVAYPIIDLSKQKQDLHWYLRLLEGVLIEALAAIGISAGTVAGKTGVWVDGRKIASIGIHVRQWVTLHGIAINIDPELAWFDAIVPCGLHGVTMTSAAKELGVAGMPHDLGGRLRAAVIQSFAVALQSEPAHISVASLPMQQSTTVKACDSPAVPSTFTPYG